MGGSDYLSYQIVFFDKYVKQSNDVGSNNTVSISNKEVSRSTGTWALLNENNSGSRMPFSIDNSTMRGFLKSNTSGKVYVIYIKTYFKYDVENDGILKEAKIENNPRRMMVCVFSL